MLLYMFTIVKKLPNSLDLVSVTLDLQIVL